MARSLKTNYGCTLYCAALIAIFTLTACATPQAENMVPQTQPIEKSRAILKSVRVVATAPAGSASPSQADLVSQLLFGKTSNSAMVGGPGTVGEPAPQSRITDEVFRDVLQRSVAQSGLFSIVRTEGKTDYELDASIFSQQMMQSWGYTAELGIRYKIFNTETGKDLWQDSIVTQCYSGSSLTAITSQSVANECAMRKNLSKLLETISKLSL
jgi:hypothetical protein